jgi:hypothetical protein
MFPRMEHTTNGSRATASQPPRERDNAGRFCGCSGPLRARRRPPLPKARTPLSAARRFGALVEQIVSDLGHEPRDIIERQLVESAASLMLRAEQLQAGIVSGELRGVRMGDQAIRASSEARRILHHIRKRAAEDAKQTTPSPAPTWSPLRSQIAGSEAVDD